ncbi:metallothiol transferase FosB [Aureibacillus halotolerans]|uniref:Metallothiol transferase n=1 Tax=Aureibacillus halotolerans TaxID=1508390 RepID=A0A4R6TVE6_9BACI|nr:metallothiol transferase FosB [Aureibacillus halotolerans]TDQ37391.1 metallothiol transferase [Aureibacillus halotolerans]
MNHICFEVQNVETSLVFYTDVLKGKRLVQGRTTAYLDIGGEWIALNENTSRQPVQQSYTHLAFSISEDDVEVWKQHLTAYGVSILKGRERAEEDRKSLYFYDPDGHLLELHTGTRADRLAYYRKTKPHMMFGEDEDEG